MSSTFDKIILYTCTYLPNYFHYHLFKFTKESTTKRVHTTNHKADHKNRTITNGARDHSST